MADLYRVWYQMRFSAATQLAAGCIPERNGYRRGVPLGVYHEVGGVRLARGFAGEEILIYIGAAMAVIPLFYAVLEDDLRRVLAYALNNQLGFMVIGVGVGTELALNGTAAHAFCHILYKSLLFMSMGAVLYRTGTARAGSLGGLYKSMPWTTGFCIVGAASMAFPLFGGFVSKSLIISAASEQGYIWAWAILMFAAAGVFLNAGLKVPYFAFFSCDREFDVRRRQRTCWLLWQ